MSTKEQTDKTSTASRTDVSSSYPEEVSSSDLGHIDPADTPGLNSVESENEENPIFLLVGIAAAAIAISLGLCVAIAFIIYLRESWRKLQNSYNVESAEKFEDRMISASSGSQKNSHLSTSDKRSHVISNQKRSQVSSTQ